MLVYADSIYSKIKKGIAREGISLVLATIDIRDYKQISMAITRYLVNELRYPGVYISTNIPYLTLSKMMQEEGINTDMLIFIDAITNTSGNRSERSGHCFYLENPQNLTDLSIAITEAMSAIPTKQKFVIFDSLSALLIYNDYNKVAEFVHFLISKLRKWSATGVIIAVEKKESVRLFERVFRFFDTVLDFTKEGGLGKKWKN